MRAQFFCVSCFVGFERFAHVFSEFYRFRAACPLQSLSIQLFHGLPDVPVRWIRDVFENTDAHSTGQAPMYNLLIPEHLQHEGR